MFFPLFPFLRASHFWLSHFKIYKTKPSYILKHGKYMQNLFSNEILIGLPLKFRYVKKKLPFSQLIKYYYKLILGDYSMSLFITFKCEARAAINTPSAATPPMSPLHYCPWRRNIFQFIISRQILFLFINIFSNESDAMQGEGQNSQSLSLVISLLMECIWVLKSYTLKCLERLR